MQNIFLHSYKNAGAKRHLGFKPRTRAIAMNAVDHPMGGRTKGGLKRNKNAKLSLNTPTKKKGKNNLILVVGRQIRQQQKNRKIKLKI